MICYFFFYLVCGGPSGSLHTWPARRRRRAAQRSPEGSRSRHSGSHFSPAGFIQFLLGICLVSRFVPHLEVEESEGDVLDDLLRHVLGVELGAELELQRRLLLHVLHENRYQSLTQICKKTDLFDLRFVLAHLCQHVLVEFEPCLVALAVGVLQTEEPDLTETYRLHHLHRGDDDHHVVRDDVDGDLVEELFAGGLGLYRSSEAKV